MTIRPRYKPDPVTRVQDAPDEIELRARSIPQPKLAAIYEIVSPTCLFGHMRYSLVEVMAGGSQR